MKIFKVVMGLSGILCPFLVLAQSDPCVCPGDQPYAGQDECGNNVCDPADVGTYPYTSACGIGTCDSSLDGDYPYNDACGNGVCHEDMEGEYPLSSYDCDGDGVLDTCVDDMYEDACGNLTCDSSLDGEFPLDAYDCDSDGELDSCEPCGSVEIAGLSFRKVTDSINLSASSEELEGDNFTWSVEDGDIDLQSTTGSTIQVSGNTLGTATIKATHEDSGISATHQVTTYHVVATHSNTEYCDGEQVSITLVTTPESVESEISNVDVIAKKPDGSTNFVNVENSGTTLQKASQGDELKWISGEFGAMWYSSGQGDCNNPLIVDYTLTATYEIEGEEETVTLSGFSVNASPDGSTPCLEGSGSVQRDWFDGFPSYEFAPIEGDEEHWKMEIVGIGTLVRDVHASAITGNTSSNSQFYPMILHEEEFHVDQIEGNVSSVIDPAKHFSVTYVYDNEISNFESIVDLGPNPTTAEVEAAADAETAFVGDKMEEHFDDTVQELGQDPNYRCPIEQQAKNAVGSLFHLTYYCAYQQTGTCP
ncbi:Ig-like domain-containing protein [Puniceicoccus vermicola]|uniref:BIG2 domain-containing protein n=1 Tax=Puniceicoccus vermicola TaxID=388746 RepID=A0A7X1E5V3_9BACT|nr:hypothetical protein [Puniceicoccus vermicola]MBC2601987.1 hypothetical protein [Puniceicoccus vermicola]